VQDVKRIEIVLDSLEADGLIEELDRIGVHDYTAIKGVFGRGARGTRGGDPFSGVFDNTYLLIAADPADLDRIVSAVRPMLASRGGLCLVSDAQSVLH